MSYNAKRLVVLLAAVALSLSAQAAPQAFQVDKSHSEAAFQVRHLISKVRGRFGDFSGTIQIDKANPSASSVEFAIKTTTVTTEDASRDKHLRSVEFFDVEKYPNITFKSTSVKPAGKDLYDVAGVLSMKGVDKPVTVRVSFLGFAKDPWGNDRAAFEATVTLNRKDFGMNWNKALDNGGYLVGDDVRVDISLETMLAKAKPAA